MIEEQKASNVETPLHHTGASASSRRSHDRGLTNLPEQLSTFIGRERDLAEIRRLLACTRLLTLTGPGGCGKTRLAIQVATELLESFPGGVWFVELAALSDPELVEQTVASLLGVHEQANRPALLTLLDVIQSQHMLLILDNCEHLLPKCVYLSETLLRHCPHLQILTTSREVFNSTAESTWPVVSLSYPNTSASLTAPSVADLMQYEAIRLFSERAAAVLPSFALTEQNASTIVQICTRLDGMPLPIELAAARMRMLAVEQIAERLDDRFHLLTTGHAAALPRQQTLRATIDWSYDLLNEQEQALFARLSVFAGRFAIEAAEAICAGESLEREQIFDLLARLIDKSLVTVELREDKAWYRLLETIREYGLEKLAERGETEMLSERYRNWYLQLAQCRLPEMAAMDQQSRLKRLELEHDNLRTALAWTQQRGEIIVVAQFGVALWNFWRLHSHLREGCRWLEAGLADSEGLPRPLRASLLNGLGVLLAMQGNYGRAQIMHEQSLELFREEGGKGNIAFTLRHLAYIAEQQGSYDHAQALLEESLVLFKEVEYIWGIAFVQLHKGNVAIKQGRNEYAKTCYQESLRLRRSIEDKHGIAGAIHNLGELARVQGDYEQAITLFRESLALYQELGDRVARALPLLNLGLIFLKQGEAEQAKNLLTESLALLWSIGDRANTAESLEGLAGVAALQRQTRRATRLLAAADALRAAIGAVQSPSEQSRYLDLKESICSQVDRPSFDKAWAEGQSMRVAEVVTYACTEETATLDNKPYGVTKAAHQEQSVPELRIFSLGEVAVYRGDEPVATGDWTYTKARELLFYLLCHSTRTKEQIGLALWPDASSTQLHNNFRVILYHLRRVLGRSEWITFDGERYAFNRNLCYWFDVEAFESKLADTGRLLANLPQQAIPYIQDAIKLYRGDFLDGCGMGDWLLPRRDELRRQYVEVAFALGRGLLAQQNFVQAIEAFRHVIATDSYFEAAHRELMRTYARMGERAQALKCYSTLLSHMRDELGTVPDAETTALFERLRRQDDI
ncbi:MAG TPA: tetratricopeptide repeat protein [Ktedonobacteraceae bacterium]|nr:tetratricopeptide repeat protein [Ktedonobacteraceae bacterium]